MSGFEEEEDDFVNNDGDHSGLGFAGILVGVGVGIGAAIYYLFKPGQETPNNEREQNYRDRSGSIVQCYICFEALFRSQRVTTLPCAHHFHTECLVPWLRESRTCPACRRAA